MGLSIQPNSNLTNMYCNAKPPKNVREELSNIDNQPSGNQFVEQAQSDPYGAWLKLMAMTNPVLFGMPLQLNKAAQERMAEVREKAIDANTVKASKSQSKAQARNDIYNQYVKNMAMINPMFIPLAMTNDAAQASLKNQGYLA